MAILTREAVARLRPYERTPSGRIKNYFDPKTHNVWSARQFRQTRAGGVRGETVTAANKAASVAGIDTRSILAKAKRNGERIERLIHSYQYRVKTETGKEPSKRAVLNDPKFWKALDGLSHKRSRNPNGIRAKALEEFGMRPRNASWKIGESPKTKKKTR